MSYDAYIRLVEILDISVDVQKSSNSTSGNDPITPQMIVVIGIGFFGGEKIKSIADIFGVSISSAQRLINDFLEAVEKPDHPFLSTDLLPESHSDHRRVANEWNDRSNAFGLYYGFLAAIDGWLCTIEQPSDVNNPADFFLGHYQRFGINVQAMCDANLWIAYISVAGNGGTNDARVFKRLQKLRDWLLRLPDGFFILGDNAYGLSNKLLIPFSGSSKQDPNHDTYNFYLSQYRIRVEMIFGRLSTKWRLFRSDLLVVNGLEKNFQIMRVGANLHNFVINADRLNFLDIREDDLESFGVEQLSKVSFDNNGCYPIVDDEIQSTTRTRTNGAVEDRRRLVVEGIIERGLTRPQHNITRNLNI